MSADFTHIYGNLATGGGIFTAESMKELADNGFTHIIDCQAEFDDTPLAAPYNIKVLWVPLFDDFTTPDFTLFDRIADFIKEGFGKNPKNHKLLCHCGAGVHRGPMVTYLVCGLMKANPKEAANAIHYHRQIANLSNVYKGAVDKYLAKKFNPGK
jgi:protein-tyrosine phosphatase